MSHATHVMDVKLVIHVTVHAKHVRTAFHVKCVMSHAIAVMDARHV